MKTEASSPSSSNSSWLEHRLNVGLPATGDTQRCQVNGISPWLALGACPLGSSSLPVGWF